MFQLFDPIRRSRRLAYLWAHLWAPIAQVLGLAYAARYDYIAPEARWLLEENCIEVYQRDWGLVRHRRYFIVQWPAASEVQWELVRGKLLVHLPAISSLRDHWQGLSHSLLPVLAPLPPDDVHPLASLLDQSTATEHP